ncbi:tRNA (N6-threonylcarbamoyladenosine(37)-N6)-methyltransferase TrmO [Psychromonas sp. psych-6C06]|uniref:tRNA (N6-threonylcarbamoyladenosine(37)-N6)-methyltransferase TrmO n=1 Tax=Psychromonas sp. psych-6C06 TaxID=2058089 RepID=UPI000C33F7E6|nr:tRNA (N6-threonylcarbamoyladenosine(37)-N6)-methyltransferase TrmO [Psychromonas sp. psych-6C06]PKF61831.1 tRNA (N6-threonylcarbamoyladenosine(37)-N6)-methyltransferase TrmO [Psychromonas sp. psych-6C06]
MSNPPLTPIATIHSPYKEKFAVPRQPGLVPSASALLEIHAPYDDINAFSGLDEFSHLWLMFIFHKNKQSIKWQPMVRPPRLGGNKRVGVFATRSPNRPNPIGLSLVEFHGIEQKQGKLFLRLSNIDLVDGTPIIDIKPYIPYADLKPEARAGFAQHIPETSMQVVFTQQTEHATANNNQLKVLITEVLKQDPRPAYKKLTLDNKRYAMNLLNFNITWYVEGNLTTVESIDLLKA